MNVPSWWEVALLAGGAYRLWRLVAFDVILEPFRGVVGVRQALGEFVGCPWCLGFWITLAWWLAWQAWPHGTLVVAAPLAMSLAVGLVSRLDP